MMDWLINGAGVLLMAAIVGWFWLWPRRSVKGGARAAIDIEVANGVYDPDVIEIRRGETATLNFHRTDPSPCAAQVVFHGLDIVADLPLGAVRSIRVAPQQVGTYRFTCQMQMYQGALRVTD